MPDSSTSPIYGLLVDKNSGEVFDLLPDQTKIGRSKQNDISFTSDLVVSRCHATISVIDGDFILEDLKSRNGTMVNGKLIENATQLCSGDEIMIGCRQLVALLTSDIANLLSKLPGQTEGISNLKDPTLVLRIFRNWGHLAVGIVSKLRQTPKRITLPRQRESTEFVRTIPLPGDPISMQSGDQFQQRIWSQFNRPF